MLEPGVFGVVGNPVGHSVSPAMHNAAFDETGEDAVYLPLEAESAADFRRFAAALGVVGVSVTAPFKRELAEGAECDEEDAGTPAPRHQHAEGLGAWLAGAQHRRGRIPGSARRDGASRSRAGARRWWGAGARRGRRRSRSLHAAPASPSTGATVRRPRHVAAVAPGAVATDAPASAGGWDLLVNATPVGTWPDADATPVPAPALAGGGLVYDLVYNPAQTRLLRDAAAAGCAVIGGLDMLVAQAARQFEWWTGRPAPVDAMRAAAERRLEEDAPAHRTGER